MSAQGALITFSTLNNGRNTSMDPEIQVTWFRIENLAPPYQPLAMGYEQAFGMANHRRGETLRPLTTSANSMNCRVTSGAPTIWSVDSCCLSQAPDVKFAVP